MNESQERVEFFQSESSFGSQSSLSNSRYNDVTNEIVCQTQNVFVTLEKELLPNQNLLDQDKLKYTLSRAQLILKDTIPGHQPYISKVASKEAKQQVDTCKDRLAKLIVNYQQLKQGSMPYKQFYNRYGKEFGLKQPNFNRKNNVYKDTHQAQQALLQPQYIQISYNGDRQKLKATPRVFRSSNVVVNDKQAASLREQIYQLRRSMQEMKRSYQEQLNNQKLRTERRLRTYLQTQPISDPEINKLKEQLRGYSQQISKEVQKNKKLQLVVTEQRKTIETLKADNMSLQEQIELLRKVDSNAMEEERSNRSYTSQMGGREDLKLEKKVRNLQQENELLKNQLKVERQRLYSMKSDLTEQERRQLERNRKQLAKKTEELSQLYEEFDRQKVQLLQLSHTAKTHTLRNEHLITQNATLKQHLNNFDAKSQSIVKSHVGEVNLQVSRNANKCRVEEYEGDGIEGYAYYEILNKQFRIRFRRACLKQKQLLSKSNGVEIGVITNFETPNTLVFLVHLTNYSDRILERIRVKIMNANGNRIAQDIFEQASLDCNDQLKIPVSLLINYYPLGALTLLLEYNVDKKKEEVRILLPAHIFKMVEVEARQNGKLNNPKKISITPQRKISKDLADIKQYFKEVRGAGDEINLSLYHRHTHTVFHLNFEQAREGLALYYEHVEGNSLITEYFIKTLVFLLSKSS